MRGIALTATDRCTRRCAHSRPGPVMLGRAALMCMPCPLWVVPAAGTHMSNGRRYLVAE